MKKIVNCFNNNCLGGLGDFLRGSLYMWDLCNKNNIEFDIDFSKHDISKFLKSRSNYEFENQDIIDTTITKNKTPNVQALYNEYESNVKEVTAKIANGEIKFIYTNYSDLMKLQQKSVIAEINSNLFLQKKCRDWFQNNFIFHDYIIGLASKKIDDLGLVEKEYNIIHFRTGDEKAFLRKGKDTLLSNLDFDLCYKKCKDKYSEDSLKLLVLSDSDELKNFIKEKAEKEELPIKVIDTKSLHTQKRSNKKMTVDHPVDEESLKNVCIDAYIMTQASEIDCYSVYFWGSGFVTWIGKIYNIPTKLNYL